MSRFMSHREMKAAARAIGDNEARLRLLENVVAALLDLTGLKLAMVEDKITLVRTQQKPVSELEIREIEEEGA